MAVKRGGLGKGLDSLIPDTGKVPEFEQGLTAYAYAQASDLCQAIESGAKLDQNQIGQLRELIEEFKKDFS